ncbi:MAG TPA: acyl carrier protein [Bacteroidia bacterium]|nr:acyl carrier protein [Bacteroidia bacterium]
MSALKNFIRDYLKENLFIAAGDDESLLKTRRMDSIGVVDLAVAIEEEYDAKINFTDITDDNFDTINKMVSFFESKGIAD